MDVPILAKKEEIMGEGETPVSSVPVDEIALRVSRYRDGAFVHKYQWVFKFTNLFFFIVYEVRAYKAVIPFVPFCL